MGSSGLQYLDRYFETSRYRLTQHQLDSFDDFLQRKIPAIVSSGNENFVNKKNDATPPAEFRLEIDDLKYSRPVVDLGEGPVEMLPNIARAMGLLYSLTLTGRVTVHTIDIAEGKSHDVVFEDVVIAKIPLMLHSRSCYLRDMDEKGMIESGEDPDDPGGYFVAWGAEKVVVTQERGANNVPVVSRKKDDKGRSEWMLNIRSAAKENTVIALTTQIVARQSDDGRFSVYVQVPGRFTRPVDIAVIFRALGVETDRDIAQHVVGDTDSWNTRDELIADILRNSLVKGHENKVWTQEQAIEFLGPLTPYGSKEVSTKNDDGSRGITHAMYILRREFLVGMGDDLHPKALYLGVLVKRLLLSAAELELPTDRESLQVKRLFTSGMLFTDVFGEAYTAFRRNATNVLDRKWYDGAWRASGDIRQVVNKNNVSTIFDHNVITEVLNSSMRGNWGKHGKSEEGGIVQDLSRISWLQFLSHLRRTNNPLDRDLKITDPHYLHSTQWGYQCVVESPDGANVGLTNNLAVMCDVTADAPVQPVMRAIEEAGGLPISRSDALSVHSPTKVVVYVNGVMSYVHDDPKKLVGRLKTERRNDGIPKMTSVVWDVVRREIRVCCDGGRCSRPLFVRGAAEPKAPENISWDDLTSGKPLEYVDIDEEAASLVAWSTDEASEYSTHVEVHPLAALSVYTINIPLIQHNQAPRNVLGAQQGKQSIGLYTSAWKSRIDTMGLVLHYPERPLVHTRYEDTVASTRHPGGFNAIVAIMCHSGYNMEDGVIINRSSIERGMFSMTYLKNIMEEEEVSGDGGSVRFENASSLPELDEYGMPFENRFVIPGDTLIGKTKIVPGSVAENASPKPADEKWAGYVVDKVLVYDKEDAQTRSSKAKKKIAKIRYRKLRSPKLGDKVASRHGQKGVVGTMLPADRMPYTQEGIVPDIIINPHAFPKRMTVAQFFECFFSKAACISGKRVDGTPFEPVNHETLQKTLNDAGYHRHSNEVLYSGASGSQLEADVFIGPTYYQRIKQMSEDKINYRGQKGARDRVTRQPVGGRARGGGLRVGEMESWSILSHGLMGMINESMLGRSDKTGVWSDGTGAMAVYNEDNDYFSATGADGEDKRFRKHVVPMAYVTLQHELVAMGIDVLHSEEHAPEEHWEDMGVTRKGCSIPW